MTKELLAVDKYYLANCYNMRDYFRKIVEDKKSAMNKEAADIVSLLLQDENYQETDEIIDDLFVMFFAGSKTVQTTTSNLITGLLHNPDIEKRLRK